MFSTGSRLAAVEADVAALEAEVRELRIAIGQLVGQIHDLQSQSPSKLRAEFAELAAAVDLDRDSNKRQFGRLFAHKRRDGAYPGGGDTDALPPEVAAHIALQNAHRNGGT